VPLLAELAQRSAGRALILKLNTELCPELAARFDIDQLPRFALFKGGQWTLTEWQLIEPSSEPRAHFPPVQLEAWFAALTSR
jgi:thioredoxin-like negative regulator of GroEL